ncbi:hypothetical protein [Amycolatopsis eburnea]|uniref:hypothetical protein n=1 Tax=Amycolatopsis eburnea TaxID=2267691 RepID=UPI001CDD0D2A|nr:hypothetical protein [Amycolatopsis eburnea]
MERVAAHRELPRDQYHCSTCGGAHRYGSQRGQRCGQTSSRPKYQRRTVPRAQAHRPDWTTPPTSQYTSPRPRTTFPPTHTPTPPREAKPTPDRKAERRQRAKESLTRDPSNIAGDVVTYVFDENGFYTRLANRAIDKVPWFHPVRYRSHGLCVCLNNVAKGLDPATYAKWAQLPLRAGLIRVGCPTFLAEVLSAASAFGVKQILGTLPHAQLYKTMRVMIPLVCPDLGICPARTDVVKTYASPALGQELKAFAADLRRAGATG